MYPAYDGYFPPCPVAPIVLLFSPSPIPVPMHTCDIAETARRHCFVRCWHRYAFQIPLLHGRINLQWIARLLFPDLPDRHFERYPAHIRSPAFRPPVHGMTNPVFQCPPPLLDTEGGTRFSDEHIVIVRSRCCFPLAAAALSFSLEQRLLRFVLFHIRSTYLPPQFFLPAVLHNSGSRHPDR